MNLAKESAQKDEKTVLPLEKLEPYLLTLLSVAASTALFFLIGRDVLGEGVIALLYLAPISWVSARWGQGPGIMSAILAALAFNYFFIPPFYTLYIGSLEGWLLLGIFLAVAILVVGRIQYGLAQARAREREAILMYELSQDLAVAFTRESIAQALAAKVQQFYQANLVQAVLEGGDPPVMASLPPQVRFKQKPDLIVPILTARELIGEVRIWEGKTALPAEPERLLKNLANQSALALERAQLTSTGIDSGSL
jgi:two-component system sensor histidine kinase KdpD